ncbi:flagellar hook-associated protein FlgK [Brevibacillus sp. B_LB10_24]|uniref:flagellar hook-associated protein FlgK n=1 Tax=Brevibacillus sp. B_LB10_24 TaxID=3380645 RepID=UPI0038B6C8E3
MPSTFHGIEVSKRGIFAQQYGLNITGHNISNANTEGYTRQRPNMEATKGIPAPGMNADRAPGLLGTGVQISDLQRLREDFLDIQFRNQNKFYGYWEKQSDVLGKIEEVFKEPSNRGLQSVMDEMWKAFQDLADDPTSSSARAVLRERAIAVADTFASVYSQLETMQTDLDNEVNVTVNNINSLASQIATLNKQIADVVPHGYQPNDLYDQRDLLIDKLSKLTDVRVTQGENGMVNVLMEGQELVNGRNAAQLATSRNPQTGFLDITLGGAPFDPANGRLAAIIDMRGRAVTNPDGTVSLGGAIPDLMGKLDTLAINLAKEINEVHRQGINITDIKNGSTQSSDLPFFVDKDELTANPNTKEYPKGAKRLTINPAIMASLDAIAAAKPEANGQVVEGNNKNALDLAAIKQKLITPGTGANDFKETSTLDDFYRYMVGQLGIDRQEGLRKYKNSEDIVSMVDNQRQSVSGVSIDEEMSELIKYQHAYSASARVMTSMDEVLDKVINGMGRVGL